MSRQGTIKRYTLIIEKLERKHFPAFEDLKSMMIEEGFSISVRTLQRDIEQIRNEFGVIIRYDKPKNGYYIDKDSTINFESFLRFLEIVATADLLMNSIQDGKEILNYISFESEGDLKGLEYLKTLLKATRERKRISFKHYNWHTKKKNKIILEPHLLKQFQNRWYVYGKIKNTDLIRTFGIDRIEDVHLLNEKFVVVSGYDPLLKFDSVIGLNSSGGEREKITFSVLYPQANYFKTLPIHSSQQIENDNETEIIVSIYVIPNFELIQKIFSQVEFIKVIEPKWLADDIVRRCKLILQEYGRKQLFPAIS